MKNLTTGETRRLAALRTSLPALPGRLSLGPSGLDPAAHAAVAEALGGILRRYRAVGACLGLLRGGRLIALFPYGDAQLEPQAPVRADTLFRVASVSKMVMTFAALRLVREGRLSLDGDLSEVLGYPLRNPRRPAVPVTLRQLLTHTAGLVDAPLYNGPGIAGRLTLREMLSPPLSRRCFSAHAPGEVFHYSNFGAGIVGSLMERVCQKPLDQVIREGLLDPLGVQGSFAPQDLTARADHLASGYRVGRFGPPRLAYDAPKIAAAPRPAFDPERAFTAGPGRLVIDMAGLARVLSLLHRDETGLLEPSLLAEMKTPQNGRGSVTGQSGRGLNLAFVPAGVLDAAPVMGHQGVAYGQNAETWIQPDTGDGVVFASNGLRLDTVGKFVRGGFEAVALGFAVLGRME